MALRDAPRWATAQRTPRPHAGAPAGSGGGKRVYPTLPAPFVPHLPPDGACSTISSCRGAPPSPGAAAPPPPPPPRTFLPFPPSTRSLSFPLPSPSFPPAVHTAASVRRIPCRGGVVASRTLCGRGGARRRRRRRPLSQPVGLARGFIVFPSRKVSPPRLAAVADTRVFCAGGGGRAE